MYKSFSNECIDDLSVLILKEDFIKKAVNYPNRQETLKYIKASKQIVHDLKRAVKFKIPAANQILLSTFDAVEESKQFINEVNLPFPVIAIEIEAMTLYDEQCNDFIVMAVQKEDEDYIHIYTMWRESGAWNCQDSEDGYNTLSFVTLNRKDFSSYLVGFNTDSVTKQRKSELMRFANAVHLRVVLNLLCVLSCTNAHIEDYEFKASQLKQDRRKKKGKLPYFEFKVLTISSDSTTHGDGAKGGSHSSPRVHLRRGHIRRLKTKNIWINSCVVGDKSKGVLHKDYLVK